jgi:hypothetical protein
MVCVWSDWTTNGFCPLGFCAEQLQVGESFLVPAGNMNVLCNYNRINGKRLGRQFVCRKEGDAIRVWRIK